MFTIHNSGIVYVTVSSYSKCICAITLSAGYETEYRSIFHSELIAKHLRASYRILVNKDGVSANGQHGHANHASTEQDRCVNNKLW